MMPGEAGPISEPVVAYSTTLPSSASDWRRSLGSSVSVVLHLLLLIFIVRITHQRQQAEERRASTQETTRPIQLDFAPPRPIPTPRPAAPDQPKTLPPAVPLTPGQEKDPGSTAKVNPTPEPEPNAPPNTTPQSATRPDPGDQDVPDASARASAPAPPSAIAAPLANDAAPSMESDARRIFGRPSSKLGPVSGSRENRPWESPNPMASDGCTLPPPSPSDSLLPPGMGAVEGKIYDENTGRPLGERGCRSWGRRLAPLPTRGASTAWSSIGPWWIAAVPSRCGSPPPAIAAATSCSISATTPTAMCLCRVSRGEGD